MNSLRQFSNQKFVRDTAILQVAKLLVIALSLASTIIVTRALGPQGYAAYALADSFLVLFAIVDVTGAFATTTLMARSMAEGDRQETTRILAFGMQSSVLAQLLIFTLLVVAGPPLARSWQGDAVIGMLAAGLALSGPADAIYNQLLHALQARRSMGTVSVVQIANQGVLSAFMIAAVLSAPAAVSLIAARVLYSYVTMIIVAVAYQRTRRFDDGETLPRLTEVARLSLSPSPRHYWRFGFLSAVDKNISDLFVPLVTQLVGAFGGVLAVGYFSLGMRALTQLSVLSASILENLTAVVPQAIARRDFVMLQRNFARLQVAVAAGSAFIYGLMALVTPVIVPVLFGTEWIPAVPVIMVLSIFGVITALGGNFAPLYRAFDLLRSAAATKLIALAVTLPVSAWLIANASQGAELNLRLLGLLQIEVTSLGAGIAASTASAVAGAWSLNGLFALSVGLTAIFTLRHLRQVASQDSTEKPGAH
jgi:O-antigen/teichoic acid export membrane protein